MSILSVPLEALPLMQPAMTSAAKPDDELKSRGLVENDRKALRLVAPWHAETFRHSRTGELLFAACDCMLDRDHSYAERMLWPAGLMKRDS
ncbi:hypothetical protein GCM10022286_21800 [Gryllotalpicola daejeonensis]|uniref:Uncharacterized protein n=1 Tax=Gryllotalpicola daejeonensis TaxID=993087 RepID=A0ABP7ZL62_9MICO